MNGWIVCLFLFLVRVNSSFEFKGLNLRLLPSIARNYSTDGTDNNLDYIIDGEEVRTTPDLRPIDGSLFIFLWWNSDQTTNISAIVITKSKDPRTVEVIANIRPTYRVPLNKSELLVRFECKIQSYVPVGVEIQFTFYQEGDDLPYTVKLMKVCTRSTNNDHTGQEEPRLVYILVIVVGLVIAAVVALFIIIAVLYQRRPKCIGCALRGSRSLQLGPVSSDDPSRNMLDSDTMEGLRHYQCEAVPRFDGTLLHMTAEAIFIPSQQPELNGGHLPSSPIQNTWVLQNLKLRDVDDHNMTVGELLKHGQFALVYEGQIRNTKDNRDVTDIFIKTLRPNVPEPILTQFVQSVMLLHNTSHKHCFNLLGVHLNEGRIPMFLFPKAPYGTLKHVLQEMKQGMSTDILKQELSSHNLVFMAIQIARGMYHITKKLNLVHKDLAARNIYVHRDLHIKIADGALSWDLYPQDYELMETGEMMAVRWQAVEVLRERAYSMYSDVWSFGVVLWEMLTLGQTPYLEVLVEDMIPYLEGGRRLPQPINCSNELFSVMGQCWALTAFDRPRFSFLTVALEELHFR